MAETHNPTEETRMPTTDQPARYFTCTLRTQIHIQAEDARAADEIAGEITMCLGLPGADGLLVVSPTAILRDVRQAPPVLLGLLPDSGLYSR